MASAGGNGLKRYLVGLGISLTMALLLQTGTLIWWASNLSTRMQFAERDIQRIDVRVGVLEGRELVAP